MNPLLSRDFQIPFAQMTPADVEPALDAALRQTEADLQELLEANAVEFATLLELDALIERLERPMGIVGHLVAVKDSPELRAAFNAVLPRYSEFMTRLLLNDALWQLLERIAASPEAQRLDGVRRRHLERTLDAFKNAGAELDAAAKGRMEEINRDLSQLSTKFSENVLDATNAFELLLTDEQELAGLPESARAMAKAAAEAKGQEGWRFTLQAPSYIPFMTYAENRDLRQKMHGAYMSRAGGGAFDNREIMAKILALRQERAQLLGYQDHADAILHDRMVRTGAKAKAFVADLTARTRPYFERDVMAVERYAKTLGIDLLQPWDVAFVSERLRQQEYEIDQEMLRPYFPLPEVLEGMFSIVKDIFGIDIVRRDNAEVWHGDVAYYDIVDEAGVHRGSFYADWFPREDKRGGAWMNEFITGGPTAEGFAPHLGLITANFTPPQGDKPALLTHDEVETTYHEFGHLLHHCLGSVEIKARNGVHVAWDFVELPSQIMENWCWERGALSRYAKHVDSGAALPADLFDKMLAARTFMGGYQQMRQLSFANVDLALHTNYDAEKDGDLVSYAQKINEAYAVRPEFAHNSFITAFSHIFSGGYSAGYYSYKWAEVLDADAFTRFQEEGIFNRQTGQEFVDTILGRGDSAPPEALFRNFMGRDPDPEALLRRNLGAL